MAELMLKAGSLAIPHLAQHPQLQQWGYRLLSNPSEDPSSKSGPQKEKWQLCFVPMPVEEWDSYCSFLLLFPGLPGVNATEFGLQSSLPTAIKKTFICFFCEELSLHGSVGAATSSLKIPVSSWTRSWSCSKWNHHLKSQLCQRKYN